MGRSSYFSRLVHWCVKQQSNLIEPKILSRSVDFEKVDLGSSIIRSWNADL